MADKITDEELAEELKAYGEVVKVPIDRKKRPILIKKLNHLKARDRPASHGKKVTPSRTRPTKTIEFSSAEESEEETAGPIGRMLGRQSTRKEPALSYSKTDTIEISPSRTRSGARRSSRRAGVGGTNSETAANSSGAGKSLYPDLSQEVTRNASNTSRNYSFEYQNEFTDSDPEESVYEVENKSMNTTFPLQDSLVGDYESPLNCSVKQRRSLARGKPKKSEKNATWSSDNNITDNKDSRDERDGHFNHSYEPRASFISTSILCLVIGFFLVVGATYIYLRQETGSMNSEQGDESSVVINYGKDENSTELFRKALELVWKLEDYLRNKGNGEKVKWTELEDKLLPDSREQVKTEDIDKAKKLIILNPHWNIRAYDENQTEIADNNYKAIYYLQADPNLGLIARIGKSMEQILYGLVLLLSCVGLMILAFIGWRYHRNKVEREQKCVFELVEKIIDLVKDNYELHQGNSRHPEFIPVSHVRDQLLPPKQRQKLRPRWEKAVKFIEANESRIRIENQSVQGEEFLVWRWLPACSNGGKYWQGQAFGENNSAAGSGATLPYSPTPCLKIRNMFDAEMETEEDWELNVQDAILEKCKGIPGILHIFVDQNSKEGCVYLKCNSCETAYKVYKSLHGCWFDGRLVTVKYLRLELYHNKFPESKQALKSLQPSNSKMTSLAQPYHRSTLELT